MNISPTTAFRRRVAAALCSAFSFGVTVLPAGAAGLEPLSVTVRYGDLDVSRQQGAAVLYSRIRAAAKHVCSPFEARGVTGTMQLNGCIDKAISDAVKTIHQPELSAFDIAKRGTPHLAHLSFRQSR